MKWDKAVAKLVKNRDALLTHHVNILEMNGESYRLSQNRARLAAANK